MTTAMLQLEAIEINNDSASPYLIALRALSVVPRETGSRRVTP
jgi:hypothetical protein